MKRLVYALALTALTSWVVAGCSHSDNLELVTGIEEREAIEILVLLRNTAAGVPDIDARKMRVTTSGRDATWTIIVPRVQADLAWKRLVSHGLPRDRDDRAQQLFQKGELIPSASVEAARLLRARESDVARALTSAPGVVDARILVSRPEHDPLWRARQDSSRVRATASVVVTYLEIDGEKQTEFEAEDIANLVAAAFQDLSPADVVVNMQSRVVSHAMFAPVPQPSPASLVDFIGDLPNHAPSIVQLVLVGLVLVAAVVLLGRVRGGRLGAVSRSERRITRADNERISS